jgi:hypothetical protein
MGSTLAIVIAIAAVVIGFLILNKIRGGDDKATVPATTSTTIPSGGLNSLPVAPEITTPQSTIFQPQTTGAKVVVANSSHQGKVAKALSTALSGKQFDMGEPTNGSEKVEKTKIQYAADNADAQAVAQSVAVLMGIDPAELETLPTPVLLADPATLGDATVLVLLGDDKAGKTFDQMTKAKTTTDTTSPAPSETPAPVST